MTSLEARTPKITILIAVRNGEATLQRCFDSVLCQSFTDWELIVIDGGSTDKTVPIIRANSHRIAHWESRPDSGISQAWNRGLLHASGDWILFLGCDDVLASPSALSEIWVYLKQAYPSHLVVYGQVAFVDQDDRVKRVLGTPWEKAERSFSGVMSLPHQGVFHHASIYSRFGIYDESLRLAGDYELLLRVVKHLKPVYCPVLITRMQMGGLSSQDTNTLRMIREYSYARKKNRVKDFSLDWWMAYVKALVKSALFKTVGARVARLVVATWRSRSFLGS